MAILGTLTLVLQMIVYISAKIKQALARTAAASSYKDPRLQQVISVLYVYSSGKIPAFFIPSNRTIILFQGIPIFP
uniref:Uncharacterized protein n=1 Tax=Salix viminalis TaxID=40686 RepID=A0A6N2L359_SALVM